MVLKKAALHDGAAFLFLCIKYCANVTQAMNDYSSSLHTLYKLQLHGTDVW